MKSQSSDNLSHGVGDFLFLYITGEGIHHAMEGGKLAAYFLDEAIQQGNYDKEMMSIYHDRWMAQFGFDFKW
jgi:flavin-dependent dehydrogenase